MSKNINNKLTKLIKYYSLINHNLIFSNNSINRYNRKQPIIQKEKAQNLEELREKIGKMKNCKLKENAKQLVFGDGLFLRSPEYIAERYSDDSSVMRRYLAICCLYNRYDLIRILDELTRFSKGQERVFLSITKLKSRSNKFRRLRNFTNFVARFMGSEFSLHGFV